MTFELTAWRRRARTPGGRFFALMMVAAEIWTTMSALETGAAALSARILLSKVGYVGIAGVAPLLPRFSLAYSGNEKRFGTTSCGRTWSVLPPPSVLLYGHGPWYWIWVTYYGISSLVALIVLVQAAFQYRTIYLWQSAIFAGAVALPWIGEVLYLTRITPFPGLDLPAIAFAATGAMILIGTSRFALFDMVPVARTALVERMSEGVIVLDSRDRVIDINPAAEALLGIETDAVGRPGQEVLPELRTLTAGDSTADRERRTIVHLQGTPPLVLDLVITTLRDRRGQQTGRLLVLRDSTVREKLVTELQTALADVKTLRGLLPICSSCKKIRDDQGYWQSLEDYISSNSEAQFTRGLCGDCISRLYPDLVESVDSEDLDR